MNNVLKKLAPELRFGEFSGDWNLKSISETSETITSGSRDWAKYYSKAGAIFIRMTNLNRNGISLLLDNLKYVSLPDKGSEGKRTSLKEDDILISITAELGKIGLIPDDLGEAYINQHTALVRPDKEKIYASFFAYKLSTKKSNKKLNRLNDSGAKAGLNLSTIRKFSFLLPCKKEQQKIANFLTAVDQRISLLKQKKAALETYKKGLMQKIFSQEIRFKDDNGEDYLDWEEKKFNQVFERVVRKNKENNQNVLTISAQEGLISQMDYFNHSVSAKNVTNYYLIKKNEFAYNKSYSKGYPMGAIKKLNKYSKGVVSTLYICFQIRIGNCVDFYEQYFESGLFNHELSKIAQEGARNHGLLNMSVVEFFKDLIVPKVDIEEQKKIAKLLSSQDKSINQLKTQIELITQFKKGLLQKMFV